LSDFILKWPVIVAPVVKRLDHRFVSQSGWQYVPKSEDQYFYVDIRHYKGKPLVLSDQTVVAAGDLVGEIHLDNQKLQKMNLTLKDIRRLLKKELNALALASCEAEDFLEVKAYWCRTVLHPFLKKENFSIREIDNTLLRIYLSFWVSTLKWVYSKGRFRLRKPMECWISKNELVTRI
jgi:hypothetical protein